jgi:hypothetical protein
LIQCSKGSIDVLSRSVPWWKKERRLLRFVDEYVGLRGGKSLVKLSFWRLLNILGLSMGIERIGSRRDLFVS